MAVYRESPPAWRRYFLPIVGIAVVLIIGVIILLITRRGNEPDQVGSALDTIGQSIDLYSIEYDKVTRGTPPEQTGAPGAVERALGAFKATEADLVQMDRGATEALGKDLQALKTALTAPDQNASSLIADADAQLLAIRTARKAAPGR